MGKVYGGVFANWYGKVGNVVGRVRQGRTIMSIYQPNVSNPRTAAQVTARFKFALLVDFLRPLTHVLRIGFRDLDGYKTGNSFSSAVGFNYNHGALHQSGSSWEIDPTKVILAQGSAVGLSAASATAEGNQITFAWNDNTDGMEASADDAVYGVAYNQDKDACVFQELAPRSTRSGEFMCPTAWSGDTVAVYAFVKDVKGRCSDSQYLAALPL